MSKKRNLACLLLGKNKNWFSSWCSVKKDYLFLFQEDVLLFVYLRSEISMVYRSSLINVRLFRTYKIIFLDVVLAENFYVNNNFLFDTLFLYNKFFKKLVCFSIYFYYNLSNAFYISIRVAKLIEKRIKFRSKIIKLFLKKIKINLSGLYVQCNGRINNVDMARTDRLYLGSLPLQSMNYFLSYSLTIANTNKGLQSIKVWACK